jgi:hypothetical protein
VTFEQLELVLMLHHPAKSPTVFVAIIMMICFQLMIVTTLFEELKPVLFSGFGVVIAIGVWFYDWVILSSRAFDDFKYRMRVLNGILLQNLKVTKKSDDPCEMILKECRLDPTVGKNLDTWFVLRLKMIEDSETELKIKKSIDLMNVSIIGLVLFAAWLVYKDLFYTGAIVT